MLLLERIHPFLHQNSHKIDSQISTGVEFQYGFELPQYKSNHIELTLALRISKKVQTSDHGGNKDSFYDRFEMRQDIVWHSMEERDL